MQYLTLDQQSQTLVEGEVVSLGLGLLLLPV
jgi:hypothetical protein